MLEFGLSNKHFLGFAVVFVLAAFAYQWRLLFLDKETSKFFILPNLYVRTFVFTFVIYLLSIVSRVCLAILMTLNKVDIMEFISNDLNTKMIMLTSKYIVPMAFLNCLLYAIIGKYFHFENDDQFMTVALFIPFLTHGSYIIFSEIE